MRQDHCWHREWLWVPECDGRSWGAAAYQRDRDGEKIRKTIKTIYRRRKEICPHGGALATVFGVQDIILSNGKMDKFGKIFPIYTHFYFIHEMLFFLHT